MRTALVQLVLPALSEQQTPLETAAKGSIIGIKEGSVVAKS